jgi:uncharacterized protein (TIGR03435 family)
MKNLILLAMVTLAARSQTAAFDVASIKPNRSLAGGSSIRLSKGRISMDNVSLKKILLNAYGIPDDRDYTVDGPSWLTTERFDVDATFPGDTPLTEVRQMIQTPLAERFKLALHRETGQLPLYTLVVSKGGPKIHAAEAGQGRTSGGPGQLEAAKISMQKLADLLGRLMGLPVINATDLSGVFDLTLEWSPDETQRLPPDGEEPAGTDKPSIFTALQEQLGLKLLGGKGPVEVLVVDRMEKAPTAN